MVEVSAKKKQNISEPLEMILLTADLLDLKANPKRMATGAVLEAKLDRGRGAVATVLVNNGTLKVSDPFIVGNRFGRVRALLDDRGPRRSCRMAFRSDVKLPRISAEAVVVALRRGIIHLRE